MEQVFSDSVSLNLRVHSPLPCAAPLLCSDCDSDSELATSRLGSRLTEVLQECEMCFGGPGEWFTMCKIELSDGSDWKDIVWYLGQLRVEAEETEQTGHEASCLNNIALFLSVLRVSLM